MPMKNKLKIDSSFAVDSDRVAAKSQKPFSHHVLIVVTMVVLYLPMFFFVLHLRSIYPHNTSLLDLSALHMLVVIALFLFPPLVLYMLGVKWHKNETYSDIKPQ